MVVECGYGIMIWMKVQFISTFKVDIKYSFLSSFLTILYTTRVISMYALNMYMYAIKYDIFVTYKHPSSWKSWHLSMNFTHFPKGIFLSTMFLSWWLLLCRSPCTVPTRRSHTLLLYILHVHVQWNLEGYMRVSFFLPPVFFSGFLFFHLISLFLLYSCISLNGSCLTHQPKISVQYQVMGAQVSFFLFLSFILFHSVLSCISLNMYSEYM